MKCCGAEKCAPSVKRNGTNLYATTSVTRGPSQLSLDGSSRKKASSVSTTSKPPEMSSSMSDKDLPEDNRQTEGPAASEAVGKSDSGGASTTSVASTLTNVEAASAGASTLAENNTSGGVTGSWNSSVASSATAQAPANNTTGHSVSAITGNSTTERPLAGGTALVTETKAPPANSSIATSTTISSSDSISASTSGSTQVYATTAPSATVPNATNKTTTSIQVKRTIFILTNCIYVIGRLLVLI
jgi:trimeric autotransporter adhesin